MYPFFLQRSGTGQFHKPPKGGLSVLSSMCDAGDTSYGQPNQKYWLFVRAGDTLTHTPWKNSLIIRERGEFHKSSTLQGVNDVAAWAPFGVRPPHFHGLEMKKQFFGLEIHKNKYVPAITFFLLIVMKIEPLEPDLKPNKQAVSREGKICVLMTQLKSWFIGNQLHGKKILFEWKQEVLLEMMQADHEDEIH